MADKSEFISLDSQADTLERLAKAYSQKKIKLALYQRQRRVLLAYAVGKIDYLPKFCFNQFSQRQSIERSHVFAIDETQVPEIEDSPVLASQSLVSGQFNYAEQLQNISEEADDFEVQKGPKDIFLSLFISMLVGVLLGFFLIIFFPWLLIFRGASTPLEIIAIDKRGEKASLLIEDASNFKLGNDHAWVIGNNTYQDFSQWQTVEMDAEKTAVLLKKMRRVMIYYQRSIIWERAVNFSPIKI